MKSRQLIEKKPLTFTKHFQNFKLQAFLVNTDLSDIFDHSPTTKH